MAIFNSYVKLPEGIYLSLLQGTHGYHVGTHVVTMSLKNQVNALVDFGNASAFRRACLSMMVRDPAPGCSICWHVMQTSLHCQSKTTKY